MRQPQQARRRALVNREDGDGYSWSQENSSGTEGARVGAEAFVARDANGSEAYGQPEWETDETLEAYIVGDGM